MTVNAIGQTISFDSTFGAAARTFTQNGDPSVFSSVYKFTTVKTDGSFFMAGEYSQPDSNYFVTKFKPDGSIDNTYGNMGKLFIKIADFGISTILSSGIDSSSRFFFVGKTTSPNGNPFFRLKVVRFTTNAKIDSSFGVNGISYIPFDNLTLSGINYPVAAYRDGRLLISSLLYEGTAESCGLVRLKESGELDSTFETNGKVYLPRSTGLTTFYTLDIQPDDEKILFTRQFSTLLRLYRYKANGTIDSSFNQTGVVNIDFPATYNSIQAIRVLSNKKIMISAGSIAGYYLYSFTANGLRDSAFGGIGYVPYNFGFKTYARDFEEQPDGKILAAGVVQDNSQPVPNINTLITRANTNGSIDSTFDNDGVWFFNYNNNPSSGMKEIALLSTGKILFSGLESGAGWVQFVTYRLKEVYSDVLPLHLLNFSGIYRNEQAILYWSTVEESNFEKFEVERSSDGMNYEPIGFRYSIGNNRLNNYQLQDDLASVTGDLFYYRLKLIDRDSRITYSEVILIRRNSNPVHGITIRPNPVINAQASVTIASNFSGDIQLRISDNNGKIVLHQRNHISNGNNSITLNNLDRLQAGVYTIQIINGKDKGSIKFEVIR